MLNRPGRLTLETSELRRQQLLNTEWGLPSRPVRIGESFRFDFEPDMLPDLARVLPLATFGDFKLPQGCQIWLQGPTAPTIANTRKYATWSAPEWTRMAYLVAIGSGAGGGGGASGAVGTARRGGGGGGQGGIARMIIPVFLLPQPFYAYVSIGGAGGAAGVIGASGDQTFFSMYPDLAPGQYFFLLRSHTTNPTGGTTVAGGGAGSADTANLGWATGLGVSNFTAGQAGIVGGNAAAATSNANLFGQAQVSTSGVGGGGADAANVGYAGGGVGSTQPGWYATIQGGAGNNAGNGSPGQDGLNRAPADHMMGAMFFIGSGGAGGGGSGQATGGRGGDGFFGGGGGGGGAGVTGGVGGKGGDGLAITIVW